jgi:hypothetical protein
MHRYEAQHRNEERHRWRIIKLADIAIILAAIVIF